MLASGGDDRRVLLWPLDKTITGQGEPVAMVAEHRSNIFCLGFDTGTTRLYSGGNDEQVSIFQAEKCVLRTDGIRLDELANAYGSS